MRKLLLAAAAIAAALLAAPAAEAQYPQGTWQLWNYACNGGSGGIGGQSYGGVVCPFDGNSASFSAPTQLSVGGAALATPVRDVDAECTAGGTATVTFANGQSLVWQVSVGSQNQPWQATGVSSATATCTFYGFAK